MNNQMNKLIRIVLIAGAIVCLMVVVYVTAINSSFHLRVFDTEYVNVNKHDGMVITIVIKTIRLMLRDPIYRTYIYVNHDWKNPIIIQETENYVGSDTVSVKALGANRYRVIIDEFFNDDEDRRLLIWKINGTHPSYGYRYE